MDETISMIADCNEAFLAYDGTRFTVSLLPNNCFTFGDLHDRLEDAKPTYSVKAGPESINAGVVSTLTEIWFRIDHKILKNRLVDVALDKAMSL